MKIPSPHRKRKARIEIIPLIDIMFFLLATFMMVSLSMVKNQAVPVNLPAAKTSAPVDRPRDATISITKEGMIYWNKEPLSRENLMDRLTSFKAQHADPQIFISGDEQAFFGEAISVLDEVRKAGINKVAIQTRKQESSALKVSGDASE